MLKFPKYSTIRICGLNFRNFRKNQKICSWNQLKTCETFRKSEKYVLDDLLDRYKSEILPRKRDKNQLGQLEWWKAQLGSYKLKDLTPSLIARLRDKLTKELSERTRRKRTPATVKRYLALLSHACSIAIQVTAIYAILAILDPRKKNHCHLAFRPHFGLSSARLPPTPRVC